MGHIPLLLCRQLRANRNPQVLLIGVALADLQQSSGINIIFNYAEEIYHSAAMETGAFCSTSKSLGTINLVLTLLALTLVDRVWRRFLMLFECAGIALSHLVLVAQLSRRTQRAAGSADHIVHDLAVTHSPSPPVTWVLISEIFPNRVRDIGSRFWPLLSGVLCLFLKTFTFPILNRVLDPAGTFWPYAGVCLAGLFLYL